MFGYLALLIEQLGLVSNFISQSIKCNIVEASYSKWIHTHICKPISVFLSELSIGIVLNTQVKQLILQGFIKHQISLTVFELFCRLFDFQEVFLLCSCYIFLFQLVSVSTDLPPRYVATLCHIHFSLYTNNIYFVYLSFCMFSCFRFISQSKMMKTSNILNNINLLMPLSLLIFSWSKIQYIA